MWRGLNTSCDIGTHSSALASVGEANEAVRRIGAIFAVDPTINALPIEQRRAVRQAQIAALVDDLESRMRGVCNKMSRDADVAKAIDHMLKRWPTFSQSPPGKPAAERSAPMAAVSVGRRPAPLAWDTIVHVRGSYGSPMPRSSAHAHRQIAAGPLLIYYF
jgi:Transposase IS66 family